MKPHIGYKKKKKDGRSVRSKLGTESGQLVSLACHRVILCDVDVDVDDGRTWQRS